MSTCSRGTWKNPDRYWIFSFKFHYHALMKNIVYERPAKVLDEHLGENPTSHTELLLSLYYQESRQTYNL